MLKWRCFEYALTQERIGTVFIGVRPERRGIEYQFGPKRNKLLDLRFQYNEKYKDYHKKTWSSFKIPLGSVVGIPLSTLRLRITFFSEESFINRSNNKTRSFLVDDVVQFAFKRLKLINQVFKVKARITVFKVSNAFPHIINLSLKVSLDFIPFSFLSAGVFYTLTCDKTF